MKSAALRKALVLLASIGLGCKKFKPICWGGGGMSLEQMSFNVFAEQSDIWFAEQMAFDQIGNWSFQAQMAFEQMTFGFLRKNGIRSK
jgi:hypothetical protein